MVAGEIFNGIEALRVVGTRMRNSMWQFRCHCGKEFITERSSRVKNGEIKSCGCHKRTSVHKESEWIDVPGYEGLYKINMYGEVYGLSTKKVLQHSKWLNYPAVFLYKNCKPKLFSIHRILAILYIPNPENKPEVNHIDGDKLNFNLSNLEWVTTSENRLHAYRYGLQTVSDNQRRVTSIRSSGSNHYNAKKVRRINDGKIYDTIRAAANENGFLAATLHKNLHDKKPDLNFEFFNK